MYPYRFQRSGDGKFIRAPDYQRNPPPWPGACYNVYAYHAYYGQPPWNFCGQTSRSDNPGATPVPHDDSWIDGIVAWMMLIHTEQTPPPVDWRSLATRYTVSETVMTADSGSGPTVIYHYVTQICPYNNTVRWVYFSCISWNGGTAYTYKMDDAGVITETGIGPSFTDPTCVPNGAAIAIMSPMSVVWTDEPRTATVSATTINFTDTHNYVGGHITFSITNTLSNTTPAGSPYPAQAWGLGPLLAELNAMLNLIDFSNPLKTYKIDGVTRVLDPGGEQIAITQGGLTDLYPGMTSLYALSSGGASVYLGQMSCNFNDVVAYGPPSGPTNYFVQEKSLVTLPAGIYKMQCTGYIQPTADTNAFAGDDGYGNGVIGTDNAQDNGSATTPLIFDDTLVSAGTLQLTIYPGPFICKVMMSIAPPVTASTIDVDVARIDQDGRPIDGSIPTTPSGVDQDGTRIDQDGRRVDQ